MTQKRRASARASQAKAGIHRNLVMVRMPDAKQLEKLLTRASIRSRVIRQIDQRTVLISRSGLAMVRKRVADLGLHEVLAGPQEHHE